MNIANAGPPRASRHMNLVAKTHKRMMNEDRRRMGQVSAQTAIGRRDVLPPPFEKS